MIYNTIINYLKDWPIGSIYISTVDSSPAELIGGTWERIKDKFLLSAGDTYSAGETGGSADAVVVEHDGHLYSDPYEQKFNGVGNCAKYLPASIFGEPASGSTTPRGWNEHQSEMFPAPHKEGESGIGKNMPPYLTVYMWKRVA